MIKNILKGAVIGISNIIPGVSGGTMAVSMGIYDKLIHCITHLFSEFKKNLLFLLPIVAGILIALVVGSFGIEYLFDAYPLPTNLTFIGLIIGGLPAVGKKVKGEKVNAGHIIAFLVFFLLVTGLALVGNVDGATADLSFSAGNVIIMVGIGIIAAATMVVPGVSGSMVLLVLGYYNPVLESINNFLRALKDFDTNGIVTGLGILVPFGVGIVIGIFAIAKLIEIIFKKFPIYAYYAIIGLIAASPIAIVIINLSVFAAATVWTVMAGIIGLLLGYIVSVKLGE